MPFLSDWRHAEPPLNDEERPVTGSCRDQCEVKCLRLEMKAEFKNRDGEIQHRFIGGDRFGRMQPECNAT